MMNRLFKKTLGFTIIEATISLALGVAFLSSSIASWYFSSKMWSEETVRSRIRYSVLKSMEQIKQDVRLSSGNNILFNPSTGTSYTALSIPGASADANGFLPVGQSGITWGKTIIYHVFTTATGAQELRKTTLNSYNSDLLARQVELDNVVAAGNGGAQGTTQTLFSAQNTTLEITPQNPTFDGYSSSTQVTPKTSFGNISLSAGTHQIRFEVTGKNPASSGYMMGEDFLSLNPSGCSQEAERLTVSSDSGKTKVQQNNLIWSGNYQSEYQSTTAGDYITFETYYDQWLESNFSNMSHSNTAVTGLNPVLTLLSREDQSLTPAWQASAQTQGTSPGNPSNQFLTDKSVRSIISGALVTRSGQMVRVKFTAGTDAALNIGTAYFGLREGATVNFLAPPLQLFFDNAAVPEGDPDPVGSINNPGSNQGISIPAGYHAWSNWFIYSIDTSIPVSDFLVSFYVSSGSAIAWTPNPAGPVESYRVDGNNAASLVDWSLLGGYQTSQSTYAATDLATWINSGTATSQVYDTKITTPSFQQLSWSSSLPVGSVVRMKVRASANPDMSGATSWSQIVGYLTSPSSLLLLSQLRYVQFQAILQAAIPYTTYPQIDDVKITWPGLPALVEVSGSYTKKPNYGIFKVMVDGKSTVASLSIKLTAREVFRGKTLLNSLSVQVKPRNTGK